MIVMLPAATSRGIIPALAHRALRGLIHAWHAARDTGQPEISQHIRDPLIREPALPRHQAERGNFLLPRATVTVWQDRRDAGDGAGVLCELPAWRPDV